MIFRILKVFYIFEQRNSSLVCIRKFKNKQKKLIPNFQMVVYFKSEIKIIIGILSCASEALVMQKNVAVTIKLGSDYASVLLSDWFSS